MTEQSSQSGEQSVSGQQDSCNGSRATFGSLVQHANGLLPGGLRTEHYFGKSARVSFFEVVRAVLRKCDVLDDGGRAGGQIDADMRELPPRSF